MKKKTTIRTAAIVLSSFVALGLGLIACSSSLGSGSAAGSDSAAASSTGSYSVDVTWTEPGTAKSLVGSRALPTELSSVTVLPYSQAGKSILIDDTYAPVSYSLTKSGGVWHGTISVTDAGPAVFALTAYSSGTTVAYVGKGTLDISATNPNSITISTGLASLVAGAIQGKVLALSTYVNTFAGAHGSAGVQTFVRTDTVMHDPFGITTDGTDIYVVNYSQNNIAKIPIATGIPTIFAGSPAGAAGSSTIVASVYADGTTALFNVPSGITTDGTYLYVLSNHQIFQVTIATSSTILYDGSSTQATFGTTDGTGVDSSIFKSPLGITVLGAYLYVADTGNGNIRRIAIGSPTAGSSTTLVGTVGSTTAWTTKGAGSTGQLGADLTSPSAICTDGAYLYVTDSASSTVLKVPLDGLTATKIITTGLSGPKGITTDGTYLYISDSASNTIKQFTLTGTAVGLVAGGLSGTANTDAQGSGASFITPYGITTDGKNLYVSDYGDLTVRKIQ